MSTTRRAPARVFMAQDVAACGRDAPGAADRADCLAGKLDQPVALHFSQVDGGDVEIAVLDEREGVQGTCQLGVARRGGDDGERVFRLQQAVDVLVFLWVIEGEVLGHELLAGQLAVHQEQLAGCLGAFQLVQAGDDDERRPDLAAQRVRADQGLEGFSAST